MTSRVVIAFLAMTVVPLVAGAAIYRWQLADPMQKAAYRVSGSVLTVAEVQLRNGCQRGFIVPFRTKFTYALKIRTQGGGIMCTQIVRNVLVPFVESGSTAAIRLQTASGWINIPVTDTPRSGLTP